MTASSEGSDTTASTFTGDIVLSETVMHFDNVDNVIQTDSYDRHHNASNTVAGLLSAGGNAGASRVTYNATWYDDAHRPTHQATYGTDE